MPRIFDNIDQSLLPALQQTLNVADRADFCVGYFNMRGWKQLDSYIERWPGGDGNCCRLLVGMQRLPEDELREALSLIRADQGIDNQTAIRLKRKLAEQFRNQLMFGAPTNEDEIGLRRLAARPRAAPGCTKRRSDDRPANGYSGRSLRRVRTPDGLPGQPPVLPTAPACRLPRRPAEVGAGSAVSSSVTNIAISAATTRRYQKRPSGATLGSVCRDFSFHKSQHSGFIHAFHALQTPNAAQPNSCT